jgi:hypothetical protein
MPFRPRPIDATLHGLTDYSAAATLTTIFPRLAHLEGTDSARQIRVSGAIHGGYSILTNYPLGIIKLIPFKLHLALDAIGAVALGATPFVTGQWRQGRKRWLPHVGLALFELSSLVMTDPSGAGDFHGDIDAVRAANTENPERKIYDPTSAVKPGTARDTMATEARTTA